MDNKIESIKKNGAFHIKKFKKENITYEMCLTAAELNGNSIEFMPEELLTKEIYELGCKSGGAILKQVPVEFVTYEMCCDAVSSYPQAIKYVPPHFITREICLSAVIKEPTVFSSIQKDIIDTNFIIDVIKNATQEIIKFLPKEIITSQLYLELVDNIPELIWEIPRKYRSAKLCKKALAGMGISNLAEAVKENPKLLSVMHTSLYSFDVCMNFVRSEYFKNEFKYRPLFGWGAHFVDGGYWECNNYSYSIKHLSQWEDAAVECIKNDCRFINYIDKNIITEKMCWAVFECAEAKETLRYIPKEYRTKEICLHAWNISKLNFYHFPEEYKDYDICLKTVEKHGNLLDEVPERFRDDKMYVAAILTRDVKYNLIPKDIWTKELFLHYIEDNNSIHIKWKDIPEQIKDYDVCKVVIDKTFLPNVEDFDEKCLTKELFQTIAFKHPSQLKKIPKEYIDTGLCTKIVVSDGDALKYIPEEFITEELCITALNSEKVIGTIIKFIPYHLRNQTICNLAFKRSDCWAMEYIPEEYVTEDMLINVAKIACGRLVDNFPERFKKDEFFDKLIKINSSCRWYIDNYIKNKQ